jgi:uncharacterized short protein YbdD (DUF466 family)
MTWKEIKDKNLLQVKTSKINNTINIEKILKYLILFFYVSIGQNDYNNNLYRKKKLKNPNNTQSGQIQ